MTDPIAPKQRIATVARNTLETKISVSLNLDGAGKGVFNTGVPFLEHMMDQIARHGMIDLDVTCEGDTTSTTTTRWKTSASPLVRPLLKRSATKKASAAMAMPMCRSMKLCRA